MVRSGAGPSGSARPRTTASRWPTNAPSWPGSAPALALIAGGLACAQFLPPLPIAHLREGIAVALLVLGGLVALRAVDRWSRTERAMRLKQDLPPSRFPAVLAILVALGSVLLVIAVLIQAI